MTIDGESPTSVAASAPAPRSVARNSVVLAAGTFGARGAAFLTSVLLARSFPVETFALLLLAQAVAQYLAMVMDFGLTLGGIRLVAADPSRTRLIAGAILLLRLGLGIASVAMVVVAATVAGADALTMAVFVLYAIAVAVGALDMSWVAQGRQATGLRAVVLAGSSLGALVLLALGLIIWRSPIVPALAQLAAVAALGGTALAAVAARYGRPVLPTRAILRQVLGTALPIGLATLLAQVYYNLDLILLAILRTPREVAIYGAVYKIVFALLSLGWVYALVVLPRMTSAHAHGSAALAAELGLRIRQLAGLILPAAVIVAVLAEPIAVTLFGSEFAEGAVPLALLALSVPISALGSLILYSLAAAGRHRALPLSSGIGAAVNLGLNLVLIPRYGMMGAVAATIAAVSSVLVVAAVQARPHLPPFDPRATVRLGVAAIGAVAVGSVLQDVTIAVSLPAALAAFVLGCLVTGFWDADDRARLRRLLRQAR